MRFETSTQMRLGQQMKLAPRMIQSMEILQMPLAELAERIEQELASNPTLELREPGFEEGVDEAELRRDREEREAADREYERELGDGEDFGRLEDFQASESEAAENAFDTGDLPLADAGERPWEADGRHDGHYSASRMAGERDGKLDAMAAAPARSASLAEQLREQWSLSEVRSDLRPLGELIIDFLDDDGYLRTPLAEVLDRAPAIVREGRVPGQTRPPTAEDMELALQAVQILLEPPGIAARDARECLLLQLDALADRVGEEDGPDEDDARVIEHARALASDFLEDLMKNRLPRIAEKSGLTMAEIRSALELMKRLSLAPGRRLVPDTAAPITPDAIVEYDEDSDRYVAYLNDARTPNVQVNREYAMMAKDRALPKRDRDFLKTNLSNASWLIDAVEQRKNTLLRVVRAVVEEQRDYFDYGPEALKPLPMTLVAERLGIHVATVSRAVSEKYLQTPRGIVPLRSFFTGGLATEGGGEMSYDAVRAAMKEVVDGEDKSKPLSDDAIATALQEKGIEIARRTVAKYRGLMGIPSARMRRQFA